MSEDINMERIKELSSAMKYYSNESDRGVTLIIAAHIEECLRRIIETFLIESKEVKELFEGPYAPFGSLSGKTKAAYVMGLITVEEKNRIDAVRSVRNMFAHEIDADFNHTKIKKICDKPIVAFNNLCARDAFLHMAQNTVLPLLYRDIETTKWKRTELTDAFIHLNTEDSVQDDT